MRYYSSFRALVDSGVEDAQDVLGHRNTLHLVDTWSCRNMNRSCAHSHCRGCEGCIDWIDIVLGARIADDVVAVAAPPARKSYIGHGEFRSVEIYCAGTPDFANYSIAAAPAVAADFDSLVLHIPDHVGAVSGPTEWQFAA